jgi:tetratricopeptide (TPR) repeat protein
VFTTVITSANCSSEKTEQEVLQAFKLRIDGKTEEAKNALLSIIEKEPQNAAAHFELARTLNYMNMRGSEEADKHLKTALELDPENVVYAYYNAKQCFLNAYVSLQKGGDNAKDLIGGVCNEFVKVLEMKPDYPEAAMYLAEIYGMLPEDLGGDKTKAEEYVQKLENNDSFYGAKARLIMMPESTDMVGYWKNYIETNGECKKSLKELGVSYLFNDNVQEATVCFEKAIALDKSQNIRILDLARYHMLKVMQNQELAETELPKSKKYIEKYLASEPAPIPPLHAFSLGMLAKIEMFSGNNEEAQKLMEKAKTLDPYFSRASAIPAASLFIPPDEADHNFRSFFSWY